MSQAGVVPVCLGSPQSEDLEVGSALTVAGWGTLQENTRTRPDTLHQVSRGATSLVQTSPDTELSLVQTSPDTELSLVET